ncbi:crotonase/enoyl-CoA hydratase family protein [Pseudomonas gingeri]|uniref:crotonase/enoyl-CoA hydratase family protein n=2 Tax=Pseudomonas gingeri TaxID=117681 RepID=UPI0015A3AA73|nr:crotonase/enoyl-CoA hydratase family protein [Pseudomonas gingeri]NWA00030.1 crotonase/enoyl-CoA hydratase family protein [Pseudomonas gingeri]NWA16869.1 crotonase/enoyl-CoA hydratase family protein [Pseudomonas gingeri]NWA53745.1 crotonase/enoyl-CoA hydratase family protein [Pseudomonas gingeri]NWA93977.1 crotonase/enoyl-CoA hydratase family protein [Pseudomonas gingeri]NWB02123.1 crotonase/enoyl-CoA hydratase family protein [Pseudomonas gingeri]
MNQPAASRVSREQRGHVLLLGLDRVAKRNAFDLDLLEALSLAYGEFERDEQSRVAVVFGHGEHFTAGLDLAKVGATMAEGWKIPTGGCDPWGVFAGPRVSKPVIVAAQGYCLTIGIELMLAADINLCASNTRFAQMEVQRGIFPFGGATLRFQQMAGWGNAMRWLLTGDEFDAHEALRLGLVQEVMASEDLLPRALQLAERIARQAPLGVQATLTSARQARYEGETAAAASLPALVKKLLTSEDAAEGVRAMLEKRPGEFKGR